MTGSYCKQWSGHLSFGEIKGFDIRRNQFLQAFVVIDPSSGQYIDIKVADDYVSVISLILKIQVSPTMSSIL